MFKVKGGGGGTQNSARRDAKQQKRVLGNYWYKTQNTGDIKVYHQTNK